MMTDTTTLERRYDIDWLRTIAIGLLLIYHIAIVFQPWAMMIGFMKSDEPWLGLWKPMSMLNVWRIPFLFYVSGMGVFFAMRKRNWKQFLLERSVRIMIPFTFGIMAITPLHIFIFQDYYELPLSYMSHPVHLWFLMNIFLYVLLLLPVFYLMKRLPESSRFRKGLSAVMSNPLTPLLVSVFFVLEVVVVDPQVFETYAMNMHGFVLGLIAFFFGFLFVYSGQAFWNTVRRWWWGYLGLAALLFVVRLLYFELNAPGYLKAIESNTWILGVLGLGYRYLNRPGRALRYLSQAAYPVYIIHMVALYGASYFVLPLDIPVVLQFVLVVVITFVLCFMIYELLIRRVGFLRPLFGLKWKHFDIEKSKAYRGRTMPETLPTRN